MKRELLGMAWFGCGLLLLAFFGLGLAGRWLAAGQWLLQAGLLWGFVCRHSMQRLSLNRADIGSPLYASLGWGNRLTILRGGLIACTGGFLFQSANASVSLWIPAVLYTLAAIIDRLDGFVARRSGQPSLLGEELDTAFDAFGMVVAPLLAVWLGKVGWIYLLVSVAYYLFQWGLERRRKRGLPVYPLVPNSLRRTLAGFQMGFLAVALWPPVHPPVTAIAGIAFMLPLLSGFVVDWGLVSGRIQAQSPATAQFFTRLNVFSNTFFQPGLRLVLTLALVWFMREMGHPLGEMGQSLGFDTRMPAAELISNWVLICSAALILAGLAGRVGALLLIVLLAWHYPGPPISIAAYLLIFSSIWLLLLGTGRFSLWQWDDGWVKRYDGA
ncbi:MAG: CDP-alcohol phosphatidyltransferase family protein [Pseudomonadales bacterium]|nr:CDP-alcohol phosphatidyltransferase family protein [Pseudomonadales bacterium]